MVLKTRSIIWRSLADQLADNQLTIVWPLEGFNQYPSDRWDVSSFGMGEWRRVVDALNDRKLVITRWTDGAYEQTFVFFFFQAKLMCLQSNWHMRWGRLNETTSQLSLGFRA